ncbi:hypothetical protein V501_02916 [Pseudogymnoascus sp. VKM F-4519 (FW-2642)]|nr:hypothetical protein V501_02916 [Pseudogymnoascus sp. VKM F-4519 (FW-2642)]
MIPPPKWIMQIPALPITENTRESAFFKSKPWSAIPEERAGVKALKDRLDKLLVDVTRQNFHAVGLDVRAKILNLEWELDGLGQPRQTSNDQRNHLIRIAADFREITAKAIDAYYGRDECFKDDSFRLATNVTAMNNAFSETIALNGFTRRFHRNPNSSVTDIRAKEFEVAEQEAISSSADSLKTPPSSYSGKYELLREYPELRALTGQLRPEPDKEQGYIMQWITKINDRSKGFGIGTLNPSLLPSLFHEQSRSRGFYANGHVEDVIETIHNNGDNALASAHPMAPAVCPPASPHHCCIGYPTTAEEFPPAEDELRIRQLLRSLDSVFGRCLLTLETTPVLFCCWLQSFNNIDFRPKPFTVLERTVSQQRYISYWKQFLCFVFRAWRTERLLRSQIYGIQFSAAQEALLARVWALLGQHLGAAGCAQDGDPEAELDDALAGLGLESEDDLEEESLGQEWGWESESESEQQSELELGLGDELESEVKSELRGKGQGQESDRDDNEPELGLELEGPGPYHELTERIFQLSCAFWTDLAKTGRTLDLPLVYFIGVLGIQRKGLNYRTAYLFTTRLAGLAWIGRLLMLEYALPQDAYGTLGWPGCSAFPDQLDRLQRIQRKYLCRGGRHAMAHTLELLFKGRSIAKKEGARANLSWSSSEQLLQIDDIGTFSMSQFRAMVWVTIQDCQRLLQKLMFEWRPAVDILAVQDNLSNAEAG